MLTVGLLALQGGFDAHARAFGGCAERDAVRIVEVRRTQELDDLDGLVIPGGESTTLLNLMRDEPWFDALRAFHARGGAIFGTCAGAILLSAEVVGPEQPSLGLLDATVRRNGYGRQVDSFEETLEVDGVGAMRAVYIRAPRIERIGPEVQVLASRDGEPVVIRQGRLLAATFHPELTDDCRLHTQFLAMMTTPENERSSGQPAASNAAHAHERRISC